MPVSVSYISSNDTFPRSVSVQWIEENRSTPVGRYDDIDWAGNPVSLVVPPLFKKYVKVLHWIDGRYDNIDKPLTEVEIKILQLPRCTPLRSLVENSRKNSSARLSWRSIARTLNVPFQASISDEWFRAALEPGCWPRYVYGPS